MKLKLSILFLIIYALNGKTQVIDSIKVFDQNRNLTQISFIEDGQIKNKKEHYEYDLKGRVTKEYITDTLGQILPRIGLAEILTYEYIDSADVSTKIIRHFDKDLNPDYNDMAFFHRLDLTTNSNGQELERIYYKIDGEIIEWIRREYNSDGLEKKIEYLDDSGELKNEGLAFIEINYDTLNRITEERSYTKDSTKFHSDRTPYLKRITYIEGIECKKYFDAQMKEIKMDRASICDPIPDFGGFNMEGEKINISLLKGKMIIVHFWSTVLTDGDVQLNDIIKLRNEYEDQGIVIFSVAVEQDSTKWWNTSQEKGVDWEYNLYDDRFQNSDVVKQFYPSYLPMTYIVNEDGLMIGHEIQQIGKLLEIMNQIMKK